MYICLQLKYILLFCSLLTFKSAKYKHQRYYRFELYYFVKLNIYLYTHRGVLVVFDNFDLALYYSRLDKIKGPI